MLIRRALAFFVPAAVLATLLSGMVYVTAQQLNRQAANDPQLQMAEDAAAALEAGAPAASVVGATPIDFGSSLAPFVVVFDSSGAVVATDGRLGGYDPAPPSGMLSSAVAGAPNMVTWQPRADVRIAAVVVHWTNGTVVAGRSLREVERRADQLLLLTAAGWAATLVALVIAALIAAWVWPKRRPDDAAVSGTRSGVGGPKPGAGGAKPGAGGAKSGAVR